MHIRTLFWKIFLSFWLVQAAFFAVTALMFRRALPETHPPGLSTTRSLLVSCEREAVIIYEKSGSDGLEQYLKDLQQSSGVHLSFVNNRGESISKTPVTREEQLLAERVVQSQRAEQSSGAEKTLLADPVVGDGGYLLVAIAQLPPPVPPPHPPGAQPLRDLGVGVLISGIVCFGLARYLTAPIGRLRVAAQQLSKGDLSVRAGMQNERRRDEIAGLVGDFDKMAAQIQSLVNAQKRLIGDVSHELRSPLTRINLALEPIRKVENPSVVRAVERVELETGRLNEMVRKLLTLSRLEAEGQLIQKSELQLGEILSEVVADTDFEAQAEQRRVVLCRFELCRVLGNKDLLRSALENVITNAIRYTRLGTEVEVSLHSVGTAEMRTATVRVRDHGPGVPEASLEALFRPFYRLDDSRERKTGGVGLGLAITKQAVSLHGGRVEAANAPDGGLEITITLPALSVGAMVEPLIKEPANS
jgi:two-component system, OmpR family, sensor histidine kinase CpxA